MIILKAINELWISAVIPVALNIIQIIFAIVSPRTAANPDHLFSDNPWDNTKNIEGPGLRQTIIEKIKKLMRVESMDLFLFS